MRRWDNLKAGRLKYEIDDGNCAEWVDLLSGLKSKKNYSCLNEIIVLKVAHVLKWHFMYFCIFAKISFLV